ncbi:MAG: PQQ-binding-like beta-propeller repeat protein [Pirellulales bacterium]
MFGGRNRMVHGIDAKDGVEQWTFTARSRVDSSCVVVGQRVYVGSGDGRLYGLDLKSGDKVWEYEAGGAFSASPAVAAGRLVIGNETGDLFCFGSQ